MSCSCNKPCSCQHSTLLISKVTSSKAKSCCPPAEDKECFKCDPFYDVTINDVAIMPAVNNHLILQVCNVNLYKAGMWIQHPLGKFQMVSGDSASNTIVLRNSLPSGEAIEGNSSPGTEYVGKQNIWIIGTPHQVDADEFAADVLGVLNNADSVCFKMVPDLGAAQKAKIYGGLVECDSGCEPDYIDPKCLRSIADIWTVGGKTFCFGDAPIISLPDEAPYDLSDVEIAAYQKAEGDTYRCLKRLPNPSQKGIYVISGSGKLRFVPVPDDYASKNYHLGITDGVPAFTEVTIADKVLVPRKISASGVAVAVAGDSATWGEEVQNSSAGTINLSTFPGVTLPANTVGVWLTVGRHLTSSGQVTVQVSGRDNVYKSPTIPTAINGSTHEAEVYIDLKDGGTFDYQVLGDSSSSYWWIIVRQAVVKEDASNQTVVVAP